MSEQKKTLSLVLPIGLMLFSFFFGAGNFIFPPILGQMSGSNLVPAIIGFCISGVGLPLLGILAMAVSRSDNPDSMAEPVHPRYARALTVICALTIGPFFAIPRTAAVSFETGILPFIPQGSETAGLLVYSVFFFILTYFLSVRPSKLVDNIGKYLTPMLLICLGILIFCVFKNPMGEIGAPRGEYVVNPMFMGLQHGYQTMDLLCALLFGAATVNAIIGKGVESQQQLTRICIYAGCLAASCLAIIYSALAYTGASSVSLLGYFSTGSILLNHVATHYMGDFGKVVLALIIFFACLTTSIGVASSISGYFAAMFNGRVQYQRLILLICVFSCAVSNFGLSKIIEYSIPVICILYPIIIAIVILNIARPIIKGDKLVFRICMTLTTCFAVFDGLRAAGIDTGAVNVLLARIIPYYEIGFGWILPCFGGIFLGLACRMLQKLAAAKA